jgi:hypothetical protein
MGAEAVPRILPPAARYRLAVSLGDEQVTRKRATSHCLDAEEGEATIRVRHPNRMIRRMIPKMWRLSSANVVRVASVLRLMTGYAGSKERNDEKRTCRGL